MPGWAARPRSCSDCCRSAWPDVSLLVIAVVFGARMVIAGVRQVVAFVKGDDVPLMRRRSLTSPQGWRLA